VKQRHLLESFDSQNLEHDVHDDERLVLDQGKHGKTFEDHPNTEIDIDVGGKHRHSDRAQEVTSPTF